jgi:hypothetical protein
LAAEDRATPLQGSLWRWIERNGWWAAFLILWAVGQVAWSLRDELREAWRERETAAWLWALGGAVAAVVAVLLGVLL